MIICKKQETVLRHILKNLKFMIQAIAKKLEAIAL